MSAMETDILVQLIHAKHACLLQLRNLGRRQLELIEAGNLSGLLDLLSAKQRPLLELQRTERAINPFRPGPRAPPLAVARDPPPVHRQIEECDALLRESSPRKNRAKRSCRSVATRRPAQLQGMHAAGQARGAYTAPAQPGFSHLNLLSDG